MASPFFLGLGGPLFYNLTVEVDVTHLNFRFGVGLFRKRIALANIVAVQPVQNAWWDGWGIRYTRNGWLYNVSGWEAVEITLASGKRLRLGTDEPDRLVRVLQAARAAGVTC